MEKSCELLPLAWFPFLILCTEFLLSIEDSRYDRVDMNFAFHSGAVYVDYALFVNEYEKLLERLGWMQHATELREDAARS